MKALSKKLWSVGRGSSDSILGVDIYGSKHHDEPWFQYTIMPMYRLGRWIHDARYWLLYRLSPKHRYHMIDTGLTPNYYDEDMLILYGCMALLKRYIESHGGTEALAAFTDDIRDGPEGNKQADRQDEALLIWLWWTVTRPAEQARHEELLMALYGTRPDGLEKITWRELPGGLREMVFNKVESDAEMEKEFRLLEDKIADDEQSMLHRLINIRPSLWT